MRLGSREIGRKRAASFQRVTVVGCCRSAWGGMPRGRVVRDLGPESSGKTTLALHVIAEAQKTEGWAAFMNANMRWDAAMPRSWAWMLTICWCRNCSGEQRLSK